MQFLSTVIKKFSATFGYFFTMTMLKLRYLLSSVTEKPCKCMYTGSDPQHSFPFWGLRMSVTDGIGKYKLRLKNRTAEEVGINNKRIFI